MGVECVVCPYQTIEALPMAMSMSTDVHYDHVNEHDVCTHKVNRGICRGLCKDSVSE